MMPQPSRALLASVLALAGTMTICAQRNPRIGYVYPAGGQQGHALQLKLAGQFLDGVSGVYVTGGGVEASVVEYVKPLNGRQLNLARDRAKELQAALAGSPRGSGKVQVRSESDTNRVEVLERAAAVKELAELRQQLANPKNRARENMQLSEDVVMSARIAPDAEPGVRELRLRTANGLSNPVRFYIGHLAEFSEFETNQPTAEHIPVSSLPVVINGQIAPGDVDRFRLRLGKGTKLVAAVRARELIPYLADAVPGWFQATLTLADTKGNELGYSDDFRCQPDPVICCEIPRDGEYVFEVKDALSRGREDFVYRLTVGELPFITSIFPLGGKCGEETQIELVGWNLPTRSQLVKAPAEAAGIVHVAIAGEPNEFDQLLFAVGTSREALEQEPNNEAATAQPVQLPVTVNGQIAQPGDRDEFRFTGRAGGEVVAEIYARRLNSPLDAALLLTDSTGRQIAFNDDCEDRASGLNTHHADSYLRTTLPADGSYRLSLTDTQRKGGKDFGYRLRVSAPQPDFELRVSPSSLNTRPGGAVPLIVFAVRKDGFTNEINFVLHDAPPGFKLSGGRIAGTNEQVKLTLTVPARPLAEPVALRIQGRAVIGGRALLRDAVPAEDMMQAFAYRHLVPVSELLVTVTGRGNSRPTSPASR